MKPGWGGTLFSDDLTPAPADRCVHGRTAGEFCPYCYPLPPFQTHSATSVAAGEAIKPDAMTLRERVYRCILTNGPITDEAIAELTEMNPSTARPRRIELQRAGRIRADGTRMTKSARQATAWVVAR
jgi:hypothetical protein